MVAPLFAALLLGRGTAQAERVTLRFSSVAPEGTAWAREMRAFGREVTAATHGEVQVKWYLSGITGNELQSHARVQRDQLDGIVSGGVLCQKLAPSMRAAHMAAQFRDRQEASYVLSRLKPLSDVEFAQAGYIDVANAGMGFSVLFSRTPVHTLADVRKLRTWLWGLDDVLGTQLPAMGLHVVPLPIEESARAYDEGKLDAFVALPAAALAFQWSAQAHYVVDLRIGYLTGCMLVARRAWDMLSHDEQQLFLSAAAKLQVRIEDVSIRDDGMLLGGLFARQGPTALPVSPMLQAEFAAVAQEAARDTQKLAPPGTIARVAAWIAEYRNNHGGEKRGWRGEQAY